jgi:hypothetical protein
LRAERNQVALDAMRASYAAGSTHPSIVADKA